MPGVGQSAFLLSPLLSYKPSDSSLSMGCMLGFFLHCSAWLHYFILEAQELRSVCVGQRTGKFLSKEPARPSPPICHNSYSPLPPLGRNHKGLGNLWVGFCLCFSGRNTFTTSPLMPQPTIYHLHFSKIRICHNTSIILQIAVTAIDSLKLIDSHSFSFITVIDTKIRTFTESPSHYWTGLAPLHWSLLFQKYQLPSGGSRKASW